MSHAHLVKFTDKNINPNSLISVNKAAELIGVEPVRIKVSDFLRWVDIHFTPMN